MRTARRHNLLAASKINERWARATSRVARLDEKKVLCLHLLKKQCETYRVRVIRRDLYLPGTSFFAYSVASITYGAGVRGGEHVQ